MRSTLSGWEVISLRAAQMLRQSARENVLAILINRRLNKRTLVCRVDLK